MSERPDAIRTPAGPAGADPVPAHRAEAAQRRAEPAECRAEAALDLTQLAEARLALFQLLQVAYAGPATPELAEALSEVAAAYGQLAGCEFPPLAPLDPSRDGPECHRLFVGPGALVAPPYESVHRSPEHALMQEETLAVRAFYRQHGLALAPGRGEPDDHIAFELEFYAHLQARALASPAHGGKPAAETLLAAQRRFLAEHLSQWVPAFCSRIEEGSSSPFYRSLAALTRQALRLEPRLLSTLCSASQTKEECLA